MADYSDYKECTDCVHYELCLHQEKFLIEHNRKDLIRRYGFGLSEPEICCNFQDRSRFVELPANDGFRTVRNVDDLGRVLIPKCIRREYDINYRDRILFIPINESKILVSKFLGSKEEEQAWKERKEND